MYLVSFLFSQDCRCARPLRTRHGPYPMTCSKRFLAKKGEKRLSFAFSIPSRAQFGRRRKRQDSVARRCSPIIRQPQKLQSRASLAFSLSLSTSHQPHSDLLHAIYNIRRRKKENDTLLCFCRRDSKSSSSSTLPPLLVELFYRNLSKPPPIYYRNTDPTNVAQNCIRYT